MGKTGYKRFKKQEKAKVKLKGNKALLPKGQNVTDTNFKIKKIIIKEQLKQHGADELLTKKHLSIKEVISRLSHHNTGMRQEALSGLQELINCHPSLLQANLAPILQSCLSLITDKESDVRSDVIKLLSAVFHRVSEKELSPAFTVVVCHLTCAMTHIEPGVRSDSLRLMDALLAAMPALTAAHTAVLLPHFLDLISQRGTQSGRTLSLHLDGRVTSDVWRGKVIGRLNRLFKVIVDQTAKELKEKESTKIVKWVKDRPIFLGLYTTSAQPERTTDSAKTLPMKEYAETLMPLLLDAFIEAVPKQNDDETQNACVVGIHTVALLQSIVEVILHIWELLKLLPNAEELKLWFRQKWSLQVASRLLRGRFPYTTSATGSRKRRRETDHLLAALQLKDPSCSLLNLQLCLLAFLLAPPGDLWTQSVQYIRYKLRGDATLSDAESGLLCQCLGASCQQTVPEGSLSLLGVIAKSQLLNSVDSPASLLAFEFLANAAFQTSHILHKDPHFVTWLDSLPGLLCQPTVPMSVVRSIARLASCNLPALTNSLDGWIEQILGNVSSVKVSGRVVGGDVSSCELLESPSSEGRRLIIGLVYWVSDWDQELVSCVREILQKRMLGDQLTNHLQDIVRLKYENTEDDNIKLMLDEILR